MQKANRREFLIQISGAGSALMLAPAARSSATAEATLLGLKAAWLDPPRSTKPHTRWWWPGSAVTRSGIEWQLKQMAGQGIGGVEICCVWDMYAKGNVPYLSDEWLALVRHAIETAAGLDIEVALTFGPGWDLGGFWTPPEHRSKVLSSAHTDVEGPRGFTGALPDFVITDKTPKSAWVRNDPIKWDAPDKHAVVAIVAGRLEAETIDADSLTDLTAQLENGHLRWQVPEGRWRLFVFRIEYTGQQNSAQNYIPRNWVIDHFNEDAVLHYCNHLNRAFTRGFGAFLGKTVDSYFVDSWENAPIHNTLLWSNTLLDDFRAIKGYDLTPWLPALWHDAGPLTRRVRYDVNEFLHHLALERTFKPLIETMARHGIQARIQPHYRFTEEIIEGAGLTPRPETEVTTARFATVPDPRKATVAGSRFYPPTRFVSAEAFTFIHRERYRTTPEEIKRAADAFLRDGITQFYNHGYVYTPEMGPAPSRDIPWANRISHITPWWPYYQHLAGYIARCCALLRHGDFVGDVLLYSPQDTFWTRKAIFGIERRVMNYGDVAQLLVANGYDYDPVNNDVLQQHASVKEGRIVIRGHQYRVLVLPGIRAMPVETLRFVRDFARAGGVVAALETLPAESVGMADWQARDAEIAALVEELKDLGSFRYLPDYKIGENPFSSNDQTYQPMPALTPPREELLRIVRGAVAPDFSLENGAQSNGVCHLHRRSGEVDVYFVTNLSPNPVRQRVSFRVAGKRADVWNPYTGEITASALTERDGRTEIALDLTPWDSTIIVFSPGKPSSIPAPARAAAPPPLAIDGPWKLTLEGPRFPRVQKETHHLWSWTDIASTRHFSGLGVYETEFELPAEYLAAAQRLTLDLGQVGCVADVRLNGKEAGVAWMQPFQLDVTSALRPGRNTLRVAVANTLINEVAGMDEPPPVPPELIPRYGGEGSRYPTGRQRFELEKKVSLPASGLLGPVRLLVG